MSDVRPASSGLNETISTAPSWRGSFCGTERSVLGSPYTRRRGDPSLSTYEIGSACRQSTDTRAMPRSESPERVNRAFLVLSVTCPGFRTAHADQTAADSCFLPSFGMGALVAASTARSRRNMPAGTHQKQTTTHGGRAPEPVHYSVIHTQWSLRSVSGSLLSGAPLGTPPHRVVSRTNAARVSIIPRRVHLEFYHVYATP